MPFDSRLRRGTRPGHQTFKAGEVINFFLIHHLQRQYNMSKKEQTKNLSPKQQYTCTSARSSLSRTMPRPWGPYILS
jgi:hypothetical protein